VGRCGGMLSMVLALALGPASAPLHAQTPSQPAPAARDTALAAMYRALSNAIATQSSAYARTGAFPWETWQPGSDSVVKVAILEATHTGWSAVALDRADPGVRCAVAVGTASPLLDATHAANRPFCVAEDGDRLAPGDFGLGLTWLYWWQDAALDAPPEQIACPALELPEIPYTNDSVYAEFVVGTDGRVEPANVAIESTGSLEGGVAMLVRLNGCRFRPATLRGVPVRTIMRQRAGLAPDQSHLPPPTPGGPPTDDESDSRAGPVDAMRSALADVSSAQASHHAAAGTYASDVTGLGTALRWDPAVHVVMLSWHASSWSAVALHDSVRARCFVAVGDSVPLPAAGLPAGKPHCTGSAGRPLMRPALGSAPAAEADEPPAAIEPPRLVSCNKRVRFKPNQLRGRRATVAFVVGLDGRAEPRTLRVVDGAGLIDDAGAVEIVAGCLFHPGKLRGRPTRVLVHQPVVFY
jgi:hypothetical protein